MTGEPPSYLYIEALKRDLAQARGQINEMFTSEVVDQCVASETQRLREELRVAENARDNWKDTAGEISQMCTNLRAALAELRRALEKIANLEHPVAKRIAVDALARAEEQADREGKHESA